MASLDDIERALRAADAAGNTDDARALSQAYTQMKGAAQPSATQPPTSSGNRLMDAVFGNPGQRFAGTPGTPFWDSKVPVSERVSNAASGTAQQLGKDIVGAGQGLAGGIAGAPGDVEAVGRAAWPVTRRMFAPSAPADVGKQIMPTSPQATDMMFGPAADEEQAASRTIGGLGSIPAAVKGTGMALRGAGTVAKTGLGITTGAGSQSIQGAYDAGKAGGGAAEAFTQNMRGQVSPTDVVDQAKAAVAQLRADKGAAYRAGIGSTIKGDPAVLDFAPIDASIRSAAKIGVYKGKTLSAGAEKVWKKIENVVDDWRQSDPAQFHTPEGLDALKQKLGNLGYEEDLQAVTKPGSIGKTILDDVYNAVKKQIVNQAPGYAQVMRDYMNASDELRNLEGSMSLGKKSLTDTSLRKLQSIMRNNANTNYGARAQMGETLNAAGNGQILPALAGQQLSDLAPRGLGRAVAGGEMGGAAIAAMSGNPAAAAAAIPVLAASSPRLVGEAAYGVGRLARPFQKAPVSGGGSANPNATAISRFLATATPQMLSRLLLSNNVRN